jgi:hypothetical protein
MSILVSNVVELSMAFNFYASAYNALEKRFSAMMPVKRFQTKAFVQMNARLAFLLQRH